MPLYEYKCSECNLKFEKRQSLELRQKAECPKCGKLANKIFSLFNDTYTWVLDSLKDDIPRRWHDPYH